MEHKLKYIQLNNGIELISKIDCKNWEHANHIKLYDPLRLYSIPPFLNPGDENTNHQTMILIKWVPWTDDVYINISVDKILIITDIALNMENYYSSILQKYDDTDINKEFDEPEYSSTDPFGLFNDLDEEAREIILESTPEELEGLTEGVAKLLTELIKNPKKTLH